MQLLTWRFDHKTRKKKAESCQSQPVIGVQLRLWLVLFTTLIWAVCFTGEALLIGWAILNGMALLFVWQMMHRNGDTGSKLQQLPAFFWLGSCLVIAVVSTPSTSSLWWISALHGVSVAAVQQRMSWSILGFLAGVSGLGVPGGAGLWEYAARVLTVIVGFGIAYRLPSTEQAQSTSLFEPVPLANLPHPRFLSQRLSLYLQQNLAHLHAEGVALYLYDIRTGALETSLKLGSLPDLVKQRGRVTMGDGCVGVCAASGRSVLFLSLLKPPQDLPKSVTWEGTPTLCVPLFDPESPSGRVLGVLQLFGTRIQPETQNIAQQLSARISEAVVAIRQREVEQLANFQRLSTIVAQVEEQSPHTRGHSHRVASLCELLSQELGLENELKEKLCTAALFHDIGKTRVSPEILNKDGKLTEEEKIEIRKYPSYSVDICAGMGFDEDTLFLIRHHGERLDGSGYPAGLDAGKQPLALRILSVADVFDTMACTRAYREALTVEERLKELAKIAGNKLDILVVETLRRAHVQGRIEPIYTEQIQSGLKIA